MVWAMRTWPPPSPAYLPCLLRCACRLQGIVGSVPYNALIFLTLYLQLMGEPGHLGGDGGWRAQLSCGLVALNMAQKA